MLDGLEDAYQPGRSMGTFGEDCAAKYNFTREQQDAFATASVERARHATADGLFKAEITPVTVKGRSGETIVAIDEGPGKVKLDKIATLKPAFKKDGGTITAASSSSINDGAAALVMMTESHAKKIGARPIARLVGHATHAQQPEWFSTAPVGAVAKLFKKTGWGVKDVDLWEVNEAFAVVPMALMKELDVAHDIVNVHGGACALGHPIGASGARIMVTLIHAVHWRRRRHRGRDRTDLNGFVLEAKPGRHPRHRACGRVRADNGVRAEARQRTVRCRHGRAAGCAQDLAAPGQHRDRHR
jgi:acetyl-CoA C-acetyltransferase